MALCLVGELASVLAPVMFYKQLWVIRKTALRKTVQVTYRADLNRVMVLVLIGKVLIYHNGKTVISGDLKL